MASNIIYETNNIIITGDICSDLNGYNTLTDLYYTLRANSDYNTTIYIDLNNVNFLDANLAAVFGAILAYFKNKNRNQFIFNGINGDTKSILVRNGFFKMKKYINNPENTTMRYFEFEKDYKDEEVIIYLTDEIFNKNSFPTCSEELQKELKKNLTELFSNAQIHGNTQSIHVCGQHFPKKGKLDFTIVNLGTSIKENVNEFHWYIKKQDYINKNAYEAILWAIVDRNSTKLDRSGGLGLKLLINFITINKGNIQIISGDGVWELTHNANTPQYEKKLNSSFPGTIVNVEFNTKEGSSNLYSLKSEKKPSFHNLF